MSCMHGTFAAAVGADVSPCREIDFGKSSRAATTFTDHQISTTHCNKDWTRLTRSGESHSRDCCMLASCPNSFNTIAAGSFI